MKNFIRLFSLSSLAMFIFASSAVAFPLLRQATGATPSAIQATVDQFRTDLGGANNGVGGSFKTGRREINWDGVPDNLSQPNALPFNFFNVTSPRGAVLNSIASIAGNHNFRVSASSTTVTPVRFGDLDATYTNTFKTFSGEKIFHARATNEIEVFFFVPGTNIPATVSGFGAVFCDVDIVSGTYIELYDVNGGKIGEQSISASNNGLSFIGFSFPDGERVARVVMRLGNSILGSSRVDGIDGVDVVALDDFIYGEPRATEYHAGDFDGDGVTDASIFRPSTSTFFVLNSGSNTVEFIPFGQNGDVPVAGDFDGDSRADVAIYRPNLGQWWINRSSDGQTTAAQFGQNGDKPVAGDYDKDGKTDIAVWRPSNGNYFVFRSTNNTFFSFPFGSTGDIPVGAPQ